MRPGHIRVFDGLRITTEHMEHLQSAIHSAVGDMREILGLGKVHSGYEVIADGPAAVIVQPGLAFDLEKNRIASDEPIRLEVSFADSPAQFVCLQYKQELDCPVEGQPTIIWDSAAVELCAAAPAEGENKLVIARLEAADDGGLRIVNLPEPPALLIDSSAPLPADGQQADGGPRANSPEPDAKRAIQPAVRLGVVLPQSGLNGSGPLAAVLLEPLRQGLAGGGSSAPDGIVVTLSEAPLLLDGMEPVGVTVTVILRGALRQNLSPANAAGGESPGEASVQDLTLPFHAVSQGEAVPADPLPAQFSLTSYFPGGESGQSPRLSQGRLAEVPFTSLAGEAQRSAWMLLEPLRLVVRALSAADGALKLAIDLVWEGGIAAAALTWVETQPVIFSWEAQLAWKALGSIQVSGDESKSVMH